MGHNSNFGESDSMGKGRNMDGGVLQKYERTKRILALLPSLFYGVDSFLPRAHLKAHLRENGFEAYE